MPRCGTDSRHREKLGETHAVLWEGGSIKDLHALGTLGGTSSTAYGVNDAGQIVGQASTENNAEFHAVLWEANGAITDLGTLGGYGSAYSINGNGGAVGQSNLTGNPGHATLWP